MRLSVFQRERLACAYYFICTGLSYGVFISRMPAFKNQIGVNDAQIGLLLLAFGGASFCGLLTSRFFIERFGSKLISGLSAIGFCVAMTLMGLTTNFWQMGFFCLWGGIATGLCDVSMNATGIFIEQKHKVKTMAFLHATFSLGGVTGSLAGSLFAALGLGTFVNLAVVLGLFLCLWPLAYKFLPRTGANKNAGSKEKSGKLPAFIYICGCMSLLCYVSEGSVGEWGGLLLFSAKGASQEVAALVFGSFSICMVIGRFSADRLRAIIGDFRLVGGGALLATIGMIIVLLSPWPILCLCAYALMGIGFAPIVPILYSRAGAVPGISAARASSAMSLLSYTGLLFFPPFLGFLAQNIGLQQALWTIALACSLVMCGSVALKTRKK